MKGFKLFLIVVIGIMPILSGCWNSRELNELSITSMLGIDRVDDDQYMFTTQMVNPGEVAREKVGERTMVTTIQEKGNTLFEAWRKLTKTSSTKLYFSHVRILVIGEDLAREGVSKILDVMLRDHEYRSDFFVLIAKDNKAHDILSILTTMEKIPGEKLFKSLKSSSSAYGSTTEVSLDTFISELVSTGQDLAVTSIYIVGDKEEGRYEAKYKVIDPNVYLKFGPLGVFNGDKLVGWMEDHDSRGYNFSQGNVKSTLVNVPCVKGDGLIGVEVIDTDAKISTQNQKGQIVGTVEVKVNGNIMDSECTAEQKFDEAQYIEKFQKIMNKTIQKEIKNSIKTAQDDYQSDIYGFGNALHREDRKKWKKVESQWREIFPTIPITVKVDSEIHNTGSITLTPKVGR